MPPSRRRGRDVDGILLLDKPGGMSSNAALQAARRLFQAAKAGHTGNLDVLAEGLLPVCFGDATKLCAFLLDADKTYEAEFQFGIATSTGDSEGGIVQRGSTHGLDLERLEQVAAGFRGEIEQVPPMYSALKHQGQPLYKLAKRGVEVERKSRRVRIFRLELRYLHDARLGVLVHCSKGTYIRTLAEDMGRALGCGAHVTRLRRTTVGPYDIAAASTIDRLRELAEAGEAALDARLLPMDTALPGMPAVALGEDARFHLQRGQSVLVPRAPNAGLVRLYDAQGAFLGIGAILDDGRIAPRRLLRANPAQ